MTQRSFEHGPSKEQTSQLDRLAERFLGTLAQLEALQALKKEAIDAWAQEGFTALDLFIDGEGDPIIIAGKRANSVEASNDNTYRFYYGSTMEDVVIPRALQGFTVDTQGSGGYTGIYTLKPEEDPLAWTAGEVDFAATEVPPALEMLRVKFGDKLGIEEASMDHNAERSLVGEVNGKETWSAEDIEAVAARVAQLRQRRDSAYSAAHLGAAELRQRRERDHAEALWLEEEGQRAAREVKVGRWAMLRGKETEIRVRVFDRVVYGESSYIDPLDQRLH